METAVKQQVLADDGAGRRFVEGSQVQGVLDSSHDELDEHDDDGYGTDSGIDEGLYTSSLRESVLDYPMERGRRYHAFRAGKYMLPNDEQEMLRLDLLHEVMTKRIGNRMFLAPIDGTQVSRILDMGTGTGVWAMEVANSFPNAEVIGNDLSPIQSHWVPSNLKFEVDDVESPWACRAPFDFIFGRCLVTSIADWPGLIQSTYENTQPGGWLELQSFDPVVRCADPTPPEHSAIVEWTSLLVHAGEKLGRDLFPAEKLEGWVRAGGYENVRSQTFNVPFGTWAKDRALKELGILFSLQMIQGLEAISLKLMCNVLGWEVGRVRELLGRVKGELEANEQRFYMVFRVVTGQKPTEKPGRWGG
ncbi:secondary metabolism regulator LAE1 [Podospora conica]|nr:secondary metabolism regulator LAE1 [Schizothecium conicum]